MLDAGAVVDCSVENLVQFAVMGSVYTEKVLGVDRPRVGLLSVGEEKSKGNEIVRAAHAKLARLPIRFIGNVEGRDLFSGEADVVVADGFAGNVALKTAEGLAEFLKSLVTQDIKSHPLTWLPAVMLLPFRNRLRKMTDYSEHGGAPLLGIDGVCMIGHGRLPMPTPSPAPSERRRKQSAAVLWTPSGSRWARG